ncbi:protein LLP [Aplysia californica]|uniref:Protein LLP n=1 Tax=Aplysia californica TaxID=6500 RepID=A0ABM0JGV1_APLCA|nr:protein LLP [Aplysia californica]
MAKSIRSKHRRQMRNVKREHFAKKDLDRLKRLASKAKELDLDNVVTMKSAEEIKDKPSTSTSDTGMEVDNTKKVFKKKTQQNEDGHYPQWMNQRAVKKQKVKVAKLKTKKKIGKKIKW